MHWNGGVDEGLELWGEGAEEVAAEEEGFIEAVVEGGRVYFGTEPGLDIRAVEEAKGVRGREVSSVRLGDVEGVKLGTVSGWV